MDRLAELISKLNEQFAQNADHGQLMMTVKQIEAALSSLSPASGKALGTSKVSVLMPGPVRFSEPQTASVMPVEPVAVTKNVEEKKIIKEQVITPKNEGWLFDPMVEIPTLAHQKSGPEVNEAIGQQGVSLNDKLKAEVVEVKHLLNEAPVRDLRKAIGVNDRFVFINELFRGDENMYERSIKTINSFRIYPEAEYWIERELKVKLGWEDSRESTQHFYQVVKRRFS